MIRITISRPILAILPSVTIIPVVITILLNLHTGGYHLITKFITSAFTPSIDKIILQSAANDILCTLSIAFISWIISTFIGLLIGILISNFFCIYFLKNESIALIFKKIIAIPKSVHEVIWGLLLLQVFGINLVVAILAIIIPYSCITAKVVADQLDNIDRDTFRAIYLSGANINSSFLSTLIPPIIPTIFSYSGYRLECAVRGATILGIFGLGGIGTHLTLTLKSLEFREFWTYLWILGLTSFFIERIIAALRFKIIFKNFRHYELYIMLLIALVILTLSIINLTQSNLLNISNLTISSIDLPTIYDFNVAIRNINIFSQLKNTLLLTFLASGIAIGGPPLLMMLLPSKTLLNIQSVVWSILRLFPTPLIALLILLCTTPNICVAALALGLNNLGVMARILKEAIEKENGNIETALFCGGVNKRVSWLYGLFSKQSASYLSYSTYRADIILRETVLVGIVGGSGLGWQLMESLSSFNWAEVIIVISLFSSITIIGEELSNYCNNLLLGFNK